MNIDPREMRQVAAASAPRVDMYAGIHKALRALMADTLMAVGRMDHDDALELAQTTQRVLELLDFCRSHLQHENDFLHAAMESRAAGSSSRIAHEHEEHAEAIEALANQTTALLQCDAASRAERSLALYRALSVFIAHNFEHMYVEETAHNAVLWARFTDAELMEIHGALVASIPPREMMFVVRWMVPFMNPAERAEMLGDMRAHAPAPAFAAALDVVRPHLTEREWAKLAASLNLPAAS
ncbi:hemerythrin domain-containing protein [Variovorax ureilyticus]|uniref:hemerythrin domain-containing protein n=1 Tax=Variovorax ureilyticus TaxID=1836198 RepID=UPI003D664CDD